MFKKKNKLISGNILAEYAIIIGAVVLAVLTMKYTMDKAIKQNVGTLTNAFLGGNQTDLVKSEAYDLKLTTKSEVKEEEGGAESRTVEGKKEGYVAVEKEGKTPFFAPDFIGSKEGAVKAP
jgi:Flp pilus assembly pilin Flp